MTKQIAVLDKLEQMVLLDVFDKKEFVEEHWGIYDYTNRRRFEVVFCEAKKLFPNRKFKVKSGIIKRIL